jgi:hypothetical protein
MRALATVVTSALLFDADCVDVQAVRMRWDILTAQHDHEEEEGKECQCHEPACAHHSFTSTLLSVR